MANATRSTDAEAVESPAPEYCPCQQSFSRLNRTDHDWLLSFEARGVAGVVELFAYAERSAEAADHEPGTLMWVDLPQFMAMHQWESQAAVYYLGGIIDDIVRHHHEAPRRARMSLEVAASVEEMAERVDRLERKVERYLGVRWLHVDVERKMIETIREL